MEDKEIIIDGIDVSKCTSFDYNNGLDICCYDDTREEKIPFANFCNENPDCYFKQLKRLEQEHLTVCYNLGLKEGECAKYRSVLEELKGSFLAFHQITIPFHVGDVGKLPHSLVDMISDYCTEIQNKINEVLK